jgi:hypothetical protein
MRGYNAPLSPDLPRFDGAPLPRGPAIGKSPLSLWERARVRGYDAPLSLDYPRFDDAP